MRDAGRDSGARATRDGFEPEGRDERLGRGRPGVTEAGREVALQAAEKTFGVPGRLRRGLRPPAADGGGDAGRLSIEAAARPVEVGRAGQRGVQEEGEQKEGHAQWARADTCPELPLSSQPKVFRGRGSLGEV